MKRVCLLPVFACLITVLTGCAGARVKEPMRAIWVTRMDYKTADDVQRIMDDCASAGFNTVLFQIRGNATAFYASPYEPWAEQFEFKDPGYDPLEVACNAAHERNLELHAWVNVMPAWRGEKPPVELTQLYHTHPEWFWYDQHGDRQALSSFYVSVNPCLPEVRDYLVNVFADIVKRYDVDGLHLDYIRFPSEPPATPRDSDIDYPYDPRTLALYAEETGQAPEDDPAAWSAWRTAQVTRLVEQIHDAMRRVKPRAALTVAAAAGRERAVERYHQDAGTWKKRGLVDAVILMNYVAEPEAFGQRIDPWLDLPGEAALVPGLMIRGGSRNQSQADAVETVKKEIAIARDKTGNFCVFSYASLFGRGPAGRERPAASGQRQPARESRSAALVPYLASLAEHDAAEAD